MKLSVFALATALLVGSSAAFVSRAGINHNNALAAILARGGASSSNTPSSSSSSKLNMAASDDPAAFAQEQIDSNDVMVFSKSYCPYCDSTKKVFERMDGVTPKYIELDLDDNGGAIQAALIGISGQKTVPNVFVKGTHIGGNDDTQLAAKMGKIKKLLAAE